MDRVPLRKTYIDIYMQTACYTRKYQNIKYLPVIRPIYNMYNTYRYLNGMYIYAPEMRLSYYSLLFVRIGMHFFSYFRHIKIILSSFQTHYKWKTGRR